VWKYVKSKWILRENPPRQVVAVVCELLPHLTQQQHHPKGNGNNRKLYDRRCQCNKMLSQPEAYTAAFKQHNDTRKKDLTKAFPKHFTQSKLISPRCKRAAASMHSRHHGFLFSIFVFRTPEMKRLNGSRTVMALKTLASPVLP